MVLRLIASLSLLKLVVLEAFIFPVASKSDVLLDLFPISNGIVKNPQKNRKRKGQKEDGEIQAGKDDWKLFCTTASYFLGLDNVRTWERPVHGEVRRHLIVGILLGYYAFLVDYYATKVGFQSWIVKEKWLDKQV